MGGKFSRPENGFPVKWYDDFVKSMPTQQGKVVAITGTTSGTGFEAARAIVSRGGTVIALNRPSERVTTSMAALQEACAAGGTAKHVDCDLQDFSSVRAAAAAVKKQVGSTGLHTLINNAGVMALQEEATKDGYDVQMQTNHLSHFLLSSLLMPSLEAAATESGEARIVNHSSSVRNGTPAKALQLQEKYMSKLADLDEHGLGGNEQQPRWQRYQQTKLANSVFTLVLKEKLEARGSRVKALVAHPGGAATNLQYTTAASGTGNGVDNRVFSFFANLFSQSAADGALPILAAAVNPDASSGDFYVPGQEGFAAKLSGDTVVGPPKKLDWRARAKQETLTTDSAGQKLLWELSERAIDQSFFP